MDSCKAVEPGAVEIHFGALSPPLSEQIASQGLPVPAALPQLQKLMDATVALHIHDCLTDSGARAVRKKLMRKIVAAIEGERKAKQPLCKHVFRPHRMLTNDAGDRVILRTEMCSKCGVEREYG